MSHANPGVESPQPPHPDEALQPDSPDFKEMPHVPALSEEREHIPVWLIVICGAILFLSGSSFTGFQIFGRDMLDQGPGGPVASTSAVVEAPATPMDLGKKIYGNSCASCHLGDGNGSPGKYPPLGGSEWVNGSKERLIAILLKGVEGPLNVKGSTYTTMVMPGQEGAMTPEKIANVLTYIRASWGNTDGPITGEEVSKAKTKFASRGNAFNEADLLQIAPHGPDPTDKPAEKK